MKTGLSRLRSFRGRRDDVVSCWSGEERGLLLGDLFLSKAFPLFWEELNGEETMSKSRNREIQREDQENNEKGGSCGDGVDERRRGPSASWCEPLQSHTEASDQTRKRLHTFRDRVSV